MKKLLIYLICFSLMLTSCTINIFGSDEQVNERPGKPKGILPPTTTQILIKTKEPTPIENPGQGENCFPWSDIPKQITKQKVCIIGRIISVERQDVRDVTTWVAYFSTDIENDVKIVSTYDILKWKGKCIKVEVPIDMMHFERSWVISSIGYTRITEIENDICSR